MLDYIVSQEENNNSLLVLKHPLKLEQQLFQVLHMICRVLDVIKAHAEYERKCFVGYSSFWSIVEIHILQTTFIVSFNL